MKKLNKKRTIQKFLRIFFLSTTFVVLLIVISLLITTVAIVDDQPLVVDAAELNTDSAIQAKIVAMQLYGNLQGGETNQQFTLKLSEENINGIIALATRGLPKIKGRVNITSVAIVSAFTLEILSSPLGKYINITTTIEPSHIGLVVYSVSFGTVNISGDLALTIIEAILNTIIKNDSFGTELVNAVESIEVTNSELTLTYHSIPSFKNAVANIKKQFKDARDDIALFGEPKVVKAYYEHICAFHSRISDLGEASLGYYLSSTLSLAKKRSYLNESPIKENRAAIIALAIFLGSPNFDTVVGALDEQTLVKCQPHKAKVTLANRNDLRLHFIFSAALKIISDSGLSFTIGEFKELLDSQQGESGFSFADLAADRAGIRFAELALDKNGALRAHQMAAILMEELTFFPSIIGLPEGITQKDFDQHGGINSDYYNQYLAIINQRIDDSPLYREF